jgi:hypothetical protein
MRGRHVYFQHNGWTVYKENRAEPWDTYTAINDDIRAGFELRVYRAIDPQIQADFVIEDLHKNMYETEMMMVSRKQSQSYWSGKL